MGEAAPKPKASARKKKGDSAVLKRSRRETHISQQSGYGTGEGTGSKPGVPDVPSDDSEEELSWKYSNDEEVGSKEERNESNDDSDDGSDKDSEETVKSGAEMELKKILIEKMEGNKSIQRSDQQRNLYKALVEAYEADKAILDTYGESTIL
nr:hypothetical protein [Tanacetum cinerariifolium]